jgi:hypothetical protein
MLCGSFAGLTNFSAPTGDKADQRRKIAELMDVIGRADRA